jgi:NAD+ synthase (glutamine-hydrolysing)
LCAAVVDIDKTRVLQTKLASFKPVFSDGCVVASVNGFKEHWSVKQAVGNKILNQSFSKHEEFAKAATLGLWDYMRKSHSSGFMLSLSGGADSSACAVLIRMMYDKLAENDLHKVQFNKMLTCVYQGTKNSGVDTFHSAKSLAESIEANFINWSVDDVIKSYTDKIEFATGKQLNWEENDIALQNIQARARAPGIWMLANINGSLLISTSNRSEAAVGYATMDGDTCGGLSPIAGIDKAFILEWLSYVYERGERGYINERKWPGLKSVVKELVPTAELRPADKKQSDEDDLMPYPVLDKIEKLAIRDKKSPVEIFYLLMQSGDMTDEQARKWIIKFFTLWCRNQWKRERYAVSFHYDDENLDPKTWCRWPVLSSGLIEELKELMPNE